MLMHSFLLNDEIDVSKSSLTNGAILLTRRLQAGFADKGRHNCSHGSHVTDGVFASCPARHLHPSGQTSCRSLSKPRTARVSIVMTVLPVYA